MGLRILSVLLFILPCFMVGCAVPHSNVFTSQCKEGMRCSMLGRLSLLTPAGGIFMDGSGCMALALPQSIETDKERWNNWEMQTVFVSGVGHQAPYDPKLNDERQETRFLSEGGPVASNACEGRYLIVSHIERSQETAWMLPPEGVIRDAKTAITVARLIWISTNPGVADRVGTDAEWQGDMLAELEGNIWTVSSNMKGMIGGGPVIELSKRDGRVISIYMTQ